MVRFLFLKISRCFIVIGSSDALSVDIRRPRFRGLRGFGIPTRVLSTSGLILGDSEIVIVVTKSTYKTI